LACRDEELADCSKRVAERAGGVPHGQKLGWREDTVFLPGLWRGDAFERTVLDVPSGGGETKKEPDRRERVAPFGREPIKKCGDVRCGDLG
jgi:hypothetical protein